MPSTLYFHKQSSTSDLCPNFIALTCLTAWLRFQDKGCRTWSLGEKPCQIGKAGIATLHKRVPGTDNFEVFGAGEYCNQTADFEVRFFT